jgi:hypothetical protein
VTQPRLAAHIHIDIRGLTPAELDNAKARIAETVAAWTPSITVTSHIPPDSPEPHAGDFRKCRACGCSMDGHIYDGTEVVCVFCECSDPVAGEAPAWRP